MKKIVILLLVLLTIVLSSCGLIHNTPNKQCASINDLVDNVDSQIMIPYFVRYLNSKSYNINYYITSIPPSGVTKTGFLVVLTKNNSTVNCNTIELRGIDLSKAGSYASEIWTTDIGYSCIIPETNMQWNDKKLYYSAYISKDAVKKDSLGIDDLTSKSYFDHFYAYIIDGNIRYSITYKDFLDLPEISKAETYLEKSKEYFEKLTTTEWY